MSRPATAAVRLLSGEREPCRVATTANIALQGLQTVDGIALAVNDRVLVKNQTDTRQNGVYTASTGVWYRASDARDPRSITEGVTVQVQDGAVHSGSAWRFATPLPNIGDDPIVIAFYLSATFSADATALIEGGKAELLSYAEDREADLIAAIDSEEAAALEALSAEETAALDRVEASSGAAAISAGQALGARNQAVAAEGRAQNLVDAASAAYDGFLPGTFYDLGRVTDNTQLFASDLGRVTAL